MPLFENFSVKYLLRSLCYLTFSFNTLQAQDFINYIQLETGLMSKKSIANKNELMKTLSELPEDISFNAEDGWNGLVKTVLNMNDTIRKLHGLHEYCETNYEGKKSEKKKLVHEKLVTLIKKINTTSKSSLKFITERHLKLDKKDRDQYLIELQSDYGDIESLIYLTYNLYDYLNNQIIKKQNNIKSKLSSSDKKIIEKIEESQKTQIDLLTSLAPDSPSRPKRDLGPKETEAEKEYQKKLAEYEKQLQLVEAKKDDLNTNKRILESKFNEDIAMIYRKKFPNEYQEIIDLKKNQQAIGSILYHNAEMGKLLLNRMISVFKEVKETKELKKYETRYNLLSNFINIDLKRFSP